MLSSARCERLVALCLCLVRCLALHRALPLGRLRLRGLLLRLAMGLCSCSSASAVPMFAVPVVSVGTELASPSEEAAVLEAPQVGQRAASVARVVPQALQRAGAPPATPNALRIHVSCAGSVRSGNPPRSASVKAS